MRRLSLENIIPAVHGSYHGDSALLCREVSFIVTNSLDAGADCLFAAIKGDHTDGHRYINDAFEAGALCVIAERLPENPAGAVIIVRSTEEALRELAAFYRMQFNIPVLGITGSVGKTTTKEMAASVLSQRLNTLKTEKNFNNELGVPFTIFRLRDEHELAVVEMGINHFGEMRRLTHTAMPDMALFTNIGFSHLEFLGNREGVLKAKSEMLEGMPESGVVFINGDDDLLSEMDCRGMKRVVFGTTEDCDVRAENLELLGVRGSVCDIVSGERRISAKITAFGAHMVYAALAGAAVGLQMGLTDNEISAGILEYEPVDGRSSVIETEYCIIIDDCYNSNPSSVLSGIQSMEAMQGRKVCILGDMLELGESADGLHYSVGKAAAEEGVDLVLTCGEFSQQVCEGVRGVSSKTASWSFPGKEELIAMLPRMIEKGDAVLVKASHSIKFDDIVNALKEL